MSTDLSNCTAFKCRVLHPPLAPLTKTMHFGMGAVLLGHRCILVGGYGDTPSRQLVYFYDTVRNSWSSCHVENMDLGFGRVKMLYILEDHLYAYTWHETKSMYNFASLDLLELEEWCIVDESKYPQMGVGTSGCFIERRREAILFSGRHSDVQLMAYRVDARLWYRPQTKGQFPARRFHHATCCSGSMMFIVGGIMSNTAVLDVHILDVTSAPYLWSSPAAPKYTPTFRYLFPVTCTTERLFVYGGYNGQKDFEVYSIAQNRWYKGMSEVNDRDSQVRFDTEWEAGTSENAAVQTKEKLWIFGGFRFPLAEPLVITPA